MWWLCGGCQCLERRVDVGLVHVEVEVSCGCFVVMASDAVCRDCHMWCGESFGPGYVGAVKGDGAGGGWGFPSSGAFVKAFNIIWYIINIAGFKCGIVSNISSHHWSQVVERVGVVW